jgi:pimeloyl-ACP methyl ester carboxylesterase
MPFLTISGEALFYAIHPAREPRLPPVVLLHGAGASHLTWPAGLRRWPCATAYLPDLPGHGRSGGCGRDTVEGYVEVVQAWRQAIDLGPAVWIGHSLGAAIALDMALSNPEACHKLVLIGAAARFTLPPALLCDLTANPSLAIDTLSSLTISPETPPAWLEATHRLMSDLPPDVLRRDFQAVAAFDVRERLGEIRAPTLVIAAVDDRLTPVADAQFLAEAIPNAQLLVLPGGGHLCVALAPSALHEAIARFTKV